ncbi:MAG TPA: hypothetical protein V6C99_03830 [Oculatellaceae cyanobacterium]|jgi:hypothetical protein
MHTAVLALGLLLILSELGAIGFMLVNSVQRIAQPEASVHLAREHHGKPKRTLKVMVLEDKKVRTHTIADPATEKPTEDLLPEEQSQVGYFSLTP